MKQPASPSPQRAIADRRSATGNLEGNPTRSCLACRRRADKSSLIRLTTVGGTVRVDSTAALPGRGAYLCHRQGCLDAALDRGGSRLRRALRHEAGHVEVNEKAIATAWNNAREERSRAEHQVATPEAQATAKVQE